MAVVNTWLVKREIGTVRAMLRAAGLGQRQGSKASCSSLQEKRGRGEKGRMRRGERAVKDSIFFSLPNSKTTKPQLNSFIL